MAEIEARFAKLDAFVNKLPMTAAMFAAELVGITIDGNADAVWESMSQIAILNGREARDLEWDGRYYGIQSRFSIFPKDADAGGAKAFSIEYSLVPNMPDAEMMIDPNQWLNSPADDSTAPPVEKGVDFKPPIGEFGKYGALQDLLAVQNHPISNQRLMTILSAASWRPEELFGQFNQEMLNVWQVTPVEQENLVWTAQLMGTNVLILSGKHINYSFSTGITVRLELKLSENQVKVAHVIPGPSLYTMQPPPASVPLGYPAGWFSHPRMGMQGPITRFDGPAAGPDQMTVTFNRYDEIEYLIEHLINRGVLQTTELSALNLVLSPHENKKDNSITHYTLSMSGSWVNRTRGVQASLTVRAFGNAGTLFEFNLQVYNEKGAPPDPLSNWASKAQYLL